MKSKNLIKYTLATFLVATLSFNCSESFLDFQPTGVISGDDLTDPTSVEGMVTAAYASLGNDNLLNGPYQDLWPLGTSRSDDGYKGGGSIRDVGQWNDTEIFTLNTPNNEGAAAMWRVLYDGVSRINEAMRRLNAIDNAAFQAEIGVSTAQRIAEMRFIRGHFNFILKKLYKFPVFLNETVEKADVIDVGNRVLSDQEGWANIADEFRAGVSTLPDFQEDEGRPTKNAARCYLAKILLYKAYVQDDNYQVTSINQGELQEALSLIETVEATGEYDLYDEFGKNFLWEYESGIESVWAIMRSVADGSPEGGRGSLSTGLNSSFGPGYGCCSFNHASNNLANAFKTDADGLPIFDGFNDPSSPQILEQPDLIANNMDPRIAHTFGLPGTTFKYDPNRIFTKSYARIPGIYGHLLGMKDQELPSCPCFRQYTAFFMTARNTDQIRWAEVLLWKAEILIELGRQDEALPIINSLRRRAANSTAWINFPDGSTTGTWVIGEYTTMGDQDRARQILRKESRLEFAFESKRFFDLVRWGITEEVLDEYFAIERVRRPYLIDANFTSGRDEYLAIPEAEISVSQGLYVQNPGYN
jgi:hypothetical protein